MDQIEKSYRILSKHPPAMFVGDFISNISQLTGTKQKDPSFGKKSLQVASFLTFFAVFFSPLKGHFIQVVATWVFFFPALPTPPQNRPDLAPFEGYSSMRSRYSPGSEVWSLGNWVFQPGKFTGRPDQPVSYTQKSWRFGSDDVPDYNWVMFRWTRR